MFTPSTTTVEVLARGSDAKVHRKVDDMGQWQETNLSASFIDIVAGLDCTANANGTHIVARGKNPVGALMYVSGTENTFNPLQHPPMVLAQVALQIICDTLFQ